MPRNKPPPSPGSRTARKNWAATVAVARRTRRRSLNFSRIRTRMAENEQACPKCGGRDVQPAGVLTRHVNPWAFYFGGWLFSLLWSGSRKAEVRCVGCDTVVQCSTRASKIARVLLVMFILLHFLPLWAALCGPEEGA